MQTTSPASRSSLFNPIRPLTLTCLFLWFLISVLLIAAAGSPTLSTGGGTRFGAFQVCYSGDGCHTIDTHCHISGSGYTDSVLEGDDCSKLQAVRAFLLMGLFLAIATTILTWYMFAVHRMADRTLYFTAHVLMAIETFFILVAFSVAAALLNQYDADKGGAFGCLVAAWVFGLLAWGLWWAAAQYEEEGVRGMTMGGVGATGGLPNKTAAKPTSNDTNGNIESVTVAPGAPAPYGGQPTYQPAYQQQYEPQAQPQYATQPLPQPQYAATQPQQQHYSPRQQQTQQTTVVQPASTVNSQPAETDGKPY